MPQETFWSVLFQALPYIFGSGGFIALIIAWKTKNATVKQTEATALESIDTIYDKMSARVEKELEKYQKVIDAQDLKIKEMGKKLELYIKQCTGCVNNKIGQDGNG